MSQIVDKYIATSGQQCEDLSGAALGYANCFTAFLALIFGGVLSLIVFFAELARERAVQLGILRLEMSSNKLEDDFRIYDHLSKEQMKMILIDKDKSIKRLIGKKSLK